MAERIGPPSRCGTILSGLLRSPDKAAVMLGRLAYRLGSSMAERIGPPSRCGTILSGLLRSPDKAAVMLGRLAYRLGSFKRYNNGMDVKQLRRRIGLTQTSLARLLGVSQPAVAAWERGTRRATGQPSQMLERLEATFDGPVRTFPAHRGRPVELPAGRWIQPVDPPDDTELPLRLDWSPRAGTRSRADRAQRAGLYAQVLDEGTPSDIRIWIDPDELVELWPDVPVARHLRGPVGELVAALQHS